ncbi:MAG: hypothetical protein H7281_17600 [Bacteriovorax sp.]|nr:hypothetical protein [Bacteriovorax sp.]
MGELGTSGTIELLQTSQTEFNLSVDVIYNLPLGGFNEQEPTSVRVSTHVLQISGNCHQNN